jgi:hypothetical protein
MLPYNVLLEIFYFYVNIDYRPSNTPRNPWLTLVHVCQSWRYIVFTSPRRVNLRIEYRGHRPISEVLDAWPVPSLPIVLTSSPGSFFLHSESGQRRWDNWVSALESEYSNRICEIRFPDMSNSLWKRFVVAMQKPFPELTYLKIQMEHLDVARVLPDSFLDGSAPRLRTLVLEGIPFPSIPRLLLSANGLVTLCLWDIPDSGYISPDAMATALTVMSSLETLNLEFRSPRPRPGPATRPLPPPTRFVLPALTRLKYRGVHEYLEDLLARIDPPLLYYPKITFFMDLNFDVPQLYRLIRHPEVLKPFNDATIWIFPGSIQLTIRGDDLLRCLLLEIRCRELEWQISSLAQLCSLSFSSFISTVKCLKIEVPDRPSHWKDDMEDTQWLELLDPFTALKTLYLADEIAPRVCGALRELSGERATEVLPELRNLFVHRPRSFPVKDLQDAIGPFVAARQLSGHPVTIDHSNGY